MYVCMYVCRGENENLSPSADVLHKTSNLVIPRFSDDGKEMDKSEKGKELYLSV